MPIRAEWEDSIKNSDLFRPEKLNELCKDTKNFVAAQIDTDSVVATIITKSVKSFPNLKAIIPTYHPLWHKQPLIQRTLTKVFAFPQRYSIRPPLNGILRGLSVSYSTKLRCLNLSRHTPASLDDLKLVGSSALGDCLSIECIHLTVFERVSFGRFDKFPERRTGNELSDVLRFFPSLRELL